MVRRRDSGQQSPLSTDRQDEIPIATRQHQQHSQRFQYTSKLSKALPAEMKRRPQWVCWRYEEREGQEELSKVPYNAKSGRKASTTNRKTWATLDQAIRAYERSGYDGIGIVLADGLAGTDLDDCIDPETGYVKPWALEIIARHQGGITEKSPSGLGIHHYWLGTLPEGRKKIAYMDGAVEMYAYADGGRFFTLTGDLLGDDDMGATLAIDQEAVNALHADIFPQAAPKAEAPRACAPLSMDDSELLTRARNNPDPRKAGRFIALFDRSDWCGKKSQSEADLALCNDLAYMCGPNAEARVADLFRRSALYREKLERDDYVERTVAKAYEGRTAFYQPREKSIDFADAPETPPEAKDTPSENQLNFNEGEAADESDQDELARLRAENAHMRQQLAQIRAVVDADGMEVAPLEKVIQIDFIVNAFTDQRRDADGFTIIKIEARRDEETGALKGRPGLADKHGVSRGTVSKALQNIEAFGTARFDETEPKKQLDGNYLIMKKVAPPLHFAPKWERPGGPRKQMGGKRPGAGRPRKQGEPCDKLLADGTQCQGILVEQRGVEVKEHEWVETICPECGKIHAPRTYTGIIATVENRTYAPSKNNQLNSDDSTETTAWADLLAATTSPTDHHTHTSVDASMRKIENRVAEMAENQLIIAPPPARPCIRCRAYDWRWTDTGWQCACMLPDEQAHIQEEMAVS